MNIQLLAVDPGTATIRRDDEPAIRMTWSELHEAQQQVGTAGYVYRWLMHEYCRCERLARSGESWESPVREVEEIIREMRAKDAAEADKLAREAQAEESRRSKEDAKQAEWDERDRVEKERRETDDSNPWWPVHAWDVPHDRVRFDVPRQNQGQIVEVAYGTFGRAEAQESDAYMRIADGSEGDHARYYKRRDVLNNE